MMRLHWAGGTSLRDHSTPSGNTGLARNNRSRRTPAWMRRLRFRQHWRRTARRGTRRGSDGAWDFLVDTSVRITEKFRYERRTDRDAGQCAGEGDHRGGGGGQGRACRGLAAARGGGGGEGERTMTIDATRRAVVAGAVSLAAAPALDTSDRDLMMRFESLGTNCEFGKAQRDYGADPIDLLRWAFTSYDVLLNLLTHRFENLGDPGQLKVIGNPPHLMVQHTGYRFMWHAFAQRGQTAEEIHAREVKRLPFLARKITEEITDATRIFVIKPMAQAPMPDDFPSKVLRALDAYGGKPILMYARDGAAMPYVEWDVTRLLRCHVAKFADQDRVMDTTRSADWLAVCRSAEHLIATA